MRFFWLQVFPFLITMSGWYYHLDVLIFIHLFSSTGVVVVAQVKLCWSVFVSIKLSQIGSFHELLVLATECFFNFDIFETQSDVFFGLLMRCGFDEGSWVYKVFGFGIFVSEIRLLLFILEAIFCGTIFFHFSGNCVASQVLLMFIVAQFISSTGLVVGAEANFRFGVFLSEKSCRHSAGSFSFFLVLTTRHSLSFHKFERQSCLFGLIMHFVPVDVTWECLIIDFSFFSVESCLFMCLSVMRFFWLQVFPFLITVSGWYYHLDVLIFIHLFSSTGVVVVAQVNFC